MIGAAIGHYRIVEKVGEGGMGVVYRALDTRLKRTVAIKVLRPELASNPARLARFEREAHILAALSHANIGAIHGVEEHNGQFWLILEFVEGETLADIIARGPLPTRRVVDIAGQMSRAIEEAHQKGIVHRDLKPANVKVRPDGAVKVLDFGLAKALLEESSSDDLSTTVEQTHEGTVLGTPAYMSPEQACGGLVGSATDVWAFGCVLFELLSGHKPFKGSTSADVRAAVVRGEPAWASLSPDTPLALRALVRSCLEIEPKNRLHHMGDARLLLDAALTDSASSTAALARPIRRWRGWLLAAVALVAAGVLGMFASRYFGGREPARAMRFPLAPPFEHDPRLGFGPSIAVSPDGRVMVYALESGTTTVLYLKRLDELDARPIAGTQGARNPFFSPHGQWLGFYDDDDRKLKKVAIGGGEPVAIVGTDFQGGADWGPDDMIVFASDAGLMRVPAGGGTPAAVSAREGSQMWPSLLPGGNVVLFSRLPARGTFDDAEILAVRLPHGEPTVVLKSAYFPHYAPTGHLIFVQGESVLAAPFDVDALKVTGPAVTILEDLWISSWTGYADFAFSNAGTLAYVSGGRRPTQSTLVTVDRKGNERALLDDRRAFRVPRVSPDSRQVALALVDRQVDVWTFDLQRKSLSRLTDSPSWDAYPLWQPVMPWMAFASMRDGVASIYRQELITGAIEKLVATNRPVYPNSWSSDGKLLAYEEEDPQTGTDLWIYSVETRERKEFLRTPYNERHAEFSPDRRFIAYESGEGGEQLEVYLRPYPQGNPRLKISTNGGTSPRWGKGGRELFYRVGGKLMAVSLTSAAEPVAGPPLELFDGPYGAYDAFPDGQSFVMVKERATGDTPTRINLVLNWFEEVKRLVASGAPSRQPR